MQVEVRFFGLSDVLNKSQVRVTLPAGASYGELLKNLADTYGEGLRERLLEKDGYLRGDVMLVVNERVADRLEQQVEGNATVYVVFQMAGGR